MKLNRPVLLATLLISFALPLYSAPAQEKPTAITPAEPLKDGWEQIDQRLLFLTVRLANVESSLEVVEKAIATHTRQRSARSGQAKRSERGNESMDRKGGGPVAWQVFYGKTAEKFFYHPVDASTTYHTKTILRQNGPAADNKVDGGVPASQGLPVHQRPPQFDYIYRANREAQARAEREAAELGDKIDSLIARRRSLEAEQSALWCEIAFRAVARHDLARKPLYRFEPIVSDVSTTSRQYAEALRGATALMCVGLSIVDEAEKDQARAFANIKTLVADGRRTFDDCWLRQDMLTAELTSSRSSAGQFAALAKHLEDVSDNLSDSYRVALEGDLAADRPRKDTFRALLQESLVNYAETILAMNEMSLAMESEWQTKPDLSKPLLVNVSFTLPGAKAVTDETAPNPEGAKSAAVDRLRGEWVGIAEETSGLPKSAAQMQVLDKQLTIRADSFTMAYTTDKRHTFRGRYDLDVGGQEGTLDFHLPRYKDGKDALLRAIYEVDGNTLKVCWTVTFDGVDRSRPASFQTEGADGAVSTVFRRGTESSTSKSVKSKDPIVGRWLHSVNGQSREMRLSADGRIDDRNDGAQWKSNGGQLMLTWPTSQSPTGSWIDQCKLSPDGQSYSGRNQMGVEIRGRKLD